ncbi:integral membrane protein [Phlyctema vagabunda]|uniref:Integral membrane protein n=1 Tax=Phlyctema vagabunda TaxID=108571 RepID=A0ABR4P725_9HELO
MASSSLFFPTRTSEKHQSGPMHRIKLMCTRFPISDASYLVGTVFAIGSAFFVVNGFFILLPLTAPELTFKGQSAYAVPVSSVIGTFLFNLGGYAGWLEGLNWKRGGAASLTDGVMIRAEDMSPDDEKSKDEEDARDSGSTSDSSTNQGTFASQQMNTPMATTKAIADEYMASPIATWQPALIGTEAFVWWPTMRQFRKAYRHDHTFWSGLIQWIGTIIFAIATITAVPGVIYLDDQTQYYYANLFPATLGGVFFIVAALFQMRAAQHSWFVPAVTKLDWHIGLWNLIGSIGFTLAGGLLYFGTTATMLQATAASFWGSWAFLIGSILQWYCSVGNYP